MILVGAEGKIEDIERFIEEVRKISEDKGIEIQVVDADLVCGKEHAISACHHAIRAFKENRNSMRKLSMELLLYMAGERQVKDAINKIGIKEESQRFVFIFLDSKDFKDLSGKISEENAESIVKSLGMKINEDVINVNREKLKRFGFTEEELDTVGKDKYADLILERVAMLDIIK